VLLPKVFFLFQVAQTTKLLCTAETPERERERERERESKEVTTIALVRSKNIVRCRPKLIFTDIKKRDIVTMK
jgi:hypothetical protein